MKDGNGRDGDVMVEVRHAISTLVEDFAVLHSCYRAAWRNRPVHFLEQLVDLL